MRHARSLSTRRRLFAVLAVIGVLTVGGTAWAYFTSSGSGSAHASTGTMSTVTLNATAGTPSTQLYPGGTGDVSLELTNPNAYAVTLVSVALKTGGTIAADGGHSTCTTTGVTFATQTGLSMSIPASASNYQIRLPGAVSMGSSSSSGCQGATFSIPVTITVDKG